MRIRHNLTNFGQCGSCMKTRESTTRLPKVVALTLIVEATSLMPVSLVRAASDCSTLITPADWGENSTGDIDVAPGGSCLFPIRMRGTVSSSGISQKPAHGNLKRLNISTYEYTAKARYKGSENKSRRSMNENSGSHSESFPYPEGAKRVQFGPG
jgi:hypothetical protein